MLDECLYKELLNHFIFHTSIKLAPWSKWKPFCYASALSGFNEPLEVSGWILLPNMIQPNTASEALNPGYFVYQ